MTKVIHLPSPSAGAPVHSSAHTTRPITAPTVAQQAAIENALSMALYFVRQGGDSAANLWAATARTNRALTLLKHVSGGSDATRLKSAFYAAIDSASGNTMGRA